MLETTATRLWSEPGGRTTAARTRSPLSASGPSPTPGASAFPYTTGILIGIGENRTERAESIFAIRTAARAHGHVQEVIVQNFRAKPDTAMAQTPDADLHDLAATIAVVAARARPEDAHPGAAQPGRRAVRADAARRHRRLGRRLARHGRPRQPRAAVAGDRRAGHPHGGGRVLHARAAHGVPEVRAGRLAVDRRAAARARRRARRPGDGPGRRERGGGRAAVAGAGRRFRVDRTHRSQHHDRHRRPHVRPPRRLRLRLRRLGRAALRAGRPPAAGPGAARLRRPRRPRARRRPTRPRCSTRHTRPRPWPC